MVAYEALRELEDAGLSAGVRNFFTVGAALSIFLVKLRLRPANRDGRRPALVRRWVNLNAHGDPVGGRLQGQPYQVDAEFLESAEPRLRQAGRRLCPRLLFSAGERRCQPRHLRRLCRPTLIGCHPVIPGETTRVKEASSSR